ncbi:TPA: helix-turn-helix domain-containing protein [Candidatus Poribacteria bacterium]|nr:helix-turn-helix domain-containing protein [Candidatus Poribacteria bacterium]
MRYSERARMAIRYATQEATRLRHDHISTGHLLLGLIRQGEGTAIDILKDKLISIDDIRSELESIMEVRTRGQQTTIGKLQLGDKAKEVLKLAEEESAIMGHKYLGTEHILLGLIREKDGVASKILDKYGVDLQWTRSVVQTVQLQEEQPIQNITFRNDGMNILSYEQKVSEIKSSKEVLNLKEASEFLDISEEEMTELLSTEDIPARKINGKWRFSRDALVKWLSEGKSRDY